MKKILVFVFFTLLTTTASAGSSVAKVESYLVSHFNKLFFSTGTKQDGPSCAISSDWAVDLTGPDAASGKAILAVVMAAQMNGKTIRVVGKGKCDVWGDRETVDYVVVVSSD